jgi:hypothetical protein
MVADIVGPSPQAPKRALCCASMKVLVGLSGVAIAALAGFAWVTLHSS